MRARLTAGQLVVWNYGQPVHDTLTQRPRPGRDPGAGLWVPRLPQIDARGRLPVSSGDVIPTRQIRGSCN